MKAIGVIPARYASSRLPGKPLAEIAGKTMIEHVYHRALAAKSLAAVYIATDDQRIFDAVVAFGGQVVMTREDHRSGTDRIAESVQGLDVDIVVNVQGDEPLLDPSEIDAVVAPFDERPDLAMATLAVPVADPRDIADPSVVKVVTDLRGDALYFSRHPIPYYRSGETGERLKHIGLYAYRKDFLLTYASLPPSPLEQLEQLEQLRVLENGYRIHVVLTHQDAVSVDTPEDLERVRALMAAGTA
jgi:3-deoxy-manno-octulosonate cytidylyltransferase (CMP-KDO synthetase)